jgi:iron(III) transport system substrate-binding protein
MRRKILAILVTTFLAAMTQAVSAQTYEQLIAGAKKEGRLILYASATAPQLQMYFAAFNKKYPFIKTEFFRTGKQALLSKVLLEEQAKQRIADVIHTSVIETNIMKKRGALSKYVPLEAAVYPAQYKDSDGLWTSAYASGTLLGFNSRQIKRVEAPKNYEDLLNPKWKSAIAIDSNKIEWFAMLLKLKGQAFMEKLAAQQPTVRSGNTLVLQLLAAGEFPISAGVYEYSVEDEGRAGGLDRLGTGDHLHGCRLAAVATASSVFRETFYRVVAVKGRPGGRQPVRPGADSR